MIRQAGGFFPGSYVNSVTSSNLGQFPLIAINGNCPKFELVTELTYEPGKNPPA